MSFTIRLDQDLTTVEAGATAPLSIEVVNRGEAPERFEIQVEGIDPEWTATPEPTFLIGGGESTSQKVFFKPPRSSESGAGNYPFVVRVRSLESGEAKTAQGVLQIKPYHHLSMEISPKKGYSTPMRQANTFMVTVMNLGNTEHTLQLSGADPEEVCAYDFQNDQITVSPGQQKDVQVTVNTANTSLVANSRLFGFSISARSIQNPNVSASTQGQLEIRPLLSFGNLAVAVLLVAVIILWYAFRPQPPAISLWTDRSTIFQGETATIHWRAANAKSVRLEIVRNRDVDSGSQKTQTDNEQDLPLQGLQEIVTSNEDTITIKAIAVGENKTVEANPVLTINVQPKPIAPLPKLLKFRASQDRVKLGDSVLLTFDYGTDVNKLVLSPTNEEILPPVKQIEVRPTQTGDVTYELFAYNDQGGHTSKKLTVTVFQASDANILTFVASPQTIAAPDNKTHVTWNVSNAALVQLDDGSGALRTVDPVNGEGIDIYTDRTITLTLIATDSKGVTTKKALKINYKPLPPPTPPPTDEGGSGGAATTTGGGATTTGGAPR